jgi:short-subunit dehydrogenase
MTTALRRLVHGTVSDSPVTTVEAGANRKLALARSTDANARPRFAVVVTGASSGIGRAIAKVAARESCAIVLVARSGEGLKAAAAEVRASGGHPYTLAVDLLAGDAPRRLDQLLTENGLTCDVLVNSAGYGLRGAAATLPVSEQLGIVDVNIRALTELSLHFLPEMVARGRGGIINLGSVAGFTPGPYMALYFASKGFVRAFSDALYEEARHTGVTVTCVAPGPVRTPFCERADIRSARLFRMFPKLDPNDVAERAWRGFKLGRRLVVPHFSARLAILVASLVPSTALLALIARLQRCDNEAGMCGTRENSKGLPRLSNATPIPRYRGE